MTTEAREQFLKLCADEGVREDSADLLAAALAAEAIQPLLHAAINAFHRERRQLESVYADMPAQMRTVASAMATELAEQVARRTAKQTSETVAMAVRDDLKSIARLFADDLKRDAHARDINANEKLRDVTMIAHDRLVQFADKANAALERVEAVAAATKEHGSRLRATHERFANLLGATWRNLVILFVGAAVIGGVISWALVRLL